jgi:hypothetical protein
MLVIKIVRVSLHAATLVTAVDAEMCSWCPVVEFCQLFRPHIGEETAYGR